MDPNLAAVLRAMAWERAKAELRSILHTYYEDMTDFNAASEAIEGFIGENEGRGTFE